MNETPKIKAKLQDYYQLGKPRITMFVCITAMAAFYLASTNGVALDKLFYSTVGIYLVSFGSCVFNQIIEIKIDRIMPRTQSRPLPTKRIPLAHAWIIGILTSGVGLYIMYFFVNMLSAIYLFVAWFGYVAFYTPLKMKTTFNTIIGAFVGALPPIVGWVAARGRVGFEAVLLFLIMFFWQLPHFLSIAWLYKADYAKADVKMLTSLDAQGIMTPRQAFLYTIMLFPVILLPFVFQLAGFIYLCGTIILTFLFAWSVVEFWKKTNEKNARKVLLTSIIYLPAVFVLLVIDKVGL